MKTASKKDKVIYIYGKKFNQKNIRKLNRIVKSGKTIRFHNCSFDYMNISDKLIDNGFFDDRCSFHVCHFNFINTTTHILIKSEFRSCTLHSCSFLSVIFANKIESCTFMSCSIRTSDMNGCITDCRFIECNLHWTKFFKPVSYTTFPRCCLSQSSFYCELLNCDFESSDMRQIRCIDMKEKRLGRILKEPMIGYKRLRGDFIGVLEIPAGAAVFSINGRKCRTNKAKCIRIEGLASQLVLDPSHKGQSFMDPTFEYEVGKEYAIDDFDMAYNAECSTGIHFFETRDEAVLYTL